MEKRKTYIAIDLKSFYASVECVERELDPLRTNLVVADVSRTEKTICLAVSPALKAWGISGRARLFEVIQRVNEVNAERRRRTGGKLTGRSWDDFDLKEHPDWALDYIAAPPRMSHYMEFSSRIYQIYLKYAAPEDIHVYSIDEVFIDATPYLHSGMDSRSFAELLIRDVLDTTGITATVGIGTNLYLCKVAMDIVAKHVRPDSRGVRIAQLDEKTYRETLWNHTPLTDFWRVGPGYAARLASRGLYTMGDIARCSLGGEKEWQNAETLYKLFGVNAELLIDHAWGIEPCGIDDIRAYRPASDSLSSGQVLSCPYPADKARIVVREMAEGLAMDLTQKRLVTARLTMYISYDPENLKKPQISQQYHGPVKEDHWGRLHPVHARGTVSLPCTSSARQMIDAAVSLFDRIANPCLLIRRLNLTVGSLTDEKKSCSDMFTQMNLFSDPEAQRQEQLAARREQIRQRSLLAIRNRFGKNAVLRGTDMLDGATTIARNGQIGGHKA